MQLSKRSFEASEIFEEGHAKSLGGHKTVYVFEIKLKRSYQEIKRVIWNFEYRDIEQIGCASKKN